MKTKNICKVALIALFLLCALTFFYQTNEKNYSKYREIESERVNHPEKLAKSETAKLSSFGFQNMTADWYWLRVIQYIWSNAVDGEYKKYLAAMMDVITDLNPYFEAPYKIGQLLIPSSSLPYEDREDPKEQKNYRDGVKLGLKWITNFCNTEKVAAIHTEDNLTEILTNPKYKNPCKNYEVPYYLAYIYYFYLRENENAANYYKVVAAQEDAPEWAKVLAAIMQWKAGDREKSLFMFLSLAQNSAWKDDKACQVLTAELQKIYTQIAIQWLPLTAAFIENIENVSKELLPSISEENEESLLADTECVNFFAKAIREINLLYLERADARYVADHPDQISAQTPEKLKETWYINFIPTDFQQYQEKDYGIIYRYNEESGWFDYEMWSAK